jgi:hypothetical protein
MDFGEWCCYETRREAEASLAEALERGLTYQDSREKLARTEAGYGRPGDPHGFRPHA